MSAKPENERERFARIIDPVAHHKARIFGAVTEGAVWVRRYRRALEKADAIIAQRESGEPVAWLVTNGADSFVTMMRTDAETWGRNGATIVPLGHIDAATSQALAEPVADDEWPRALARLKHTEPHPDQGIACVGTTDLAMALDRLEKFAEVALGNAVEVSRLLAVQAEAQARIEALPRELTGDARGAAELAFLKTKGHASHLAVRAIWEAIVKNWPTALLSGSTPKPDEALAICREVAALESEDGGRSFPSKDLCARARALTAALSGDA